MEKKQMGFRKGLKDVCPSNQSKSIKLKPSRYEVIYLFLLKI
ncbi:hypothetical protein [Gelidibacter algens]|jgi:hypothetical protein|nr:hypothetical protein [Gelidibacter algens]